MNEFEEHGAVSTLRRLKSQGFSEDELVRATGASARSMRRWISEGVDPARGGYEDRIDDLRAINEILVTAYSADLARSWLKARNRLLDYERPIDVLAAGRFDDVREVAEAFVAGDHSYPGPSAPPNAG